MKKHELLSPAGSPEIFREVILAGADAVYIGGDKFGARAFAKNFSKDDVLEALDFAHLRGRKVFLTVNTLLKNLEMKRDLYDYILPFYLHGLDAIIVQDYGVFWFLREQFPNLPLHVSTQMSVSSAEGAALLQEQGATRIVTARELSFTEIRQIYDRTHMEIESFVHGALCYCYSGQCLMSSMLGGRSGNRGRCAQPCRLPYSVITDQNKALHAKEKFPLSPKDLCTLELIPKICQSGVYSFKIEGRMKQLEYAAGVTEIYREYIDRYESDPTDYQVDRKDYQALLALGNRNGFTQGYYDMHNGRSMMTLTDSSHSSEERKTVYQRKTMDAILIDGQAYLKAGEPASYMVALKDHPEIVGYAEGDLVEPAAKRPLLKADVRKQLEKMGSSEFSLHDLTVELQGECFYSVKQLNDLRRRALDDLKANLLQGFERSEDLPHIDLKENNQRMKTAKLHVIVSTKEQLQAALESEEVSLISIDGICPDEDIVRKIHDAGKKAGYCFPYIFRTDTQNDYDRLHYVDLIAQFDRFWVRSYDSLAYVMHHSELDQKKLCLDHNLYIFSQTARQAFEDLIDRDVIYTVSFELNSKELRHMPNSRGDFMVYGYQPLMISAQCVYKNYDSCKKGQSDHTGLYLSDRYDKKFLINRNCEPCYNVIYNSQPLYLLHQAGEVAPLGFAYHRIQFTVESAAEAGLILHAYQEAFVKNGKADPGKLSYTTGHFHRGVD